MIKEIWKLIRLLFTKPKDTNELNLKEMKYFPFKGYLFLMWCGIIIFRSDKRELIESYKGTDIYLVDINHEKIHLNQAKYLGSWLKFYIIYLWEWIKGGAFFNKGSYYTIPFEVEAYANENNLNYTRSYNPNNLKTRYTLKHRKFTYKLRRSYWKRWIRTL